MIINIGQRTDIPAFYSEWFYRRIEEGFVHVRNPYYPQQVIEYKLNPHVVDCLSFCTKNPAPMLKNLSLIDKFRQIWSVTITPYEKEIEPFVPPYEEVVESFRQLSLRIGKQSMIWRYDPIFINEKYTIDYHIRSFEKMCQFLHGYTNQCVISFVDLYEKTKLNFPDVKEVTYDQQCFIAKEFVKIAKKYTIEIRSCLEGNHLKKYGVLCDGCLNQDVVEKAIGENLIIKKKTSVRKGCQCLLGNDIGVYNTCLHQCIYCYANENKKRVLQTVKQHDPYSSLLIGHLNVDDHIVLSKQQTWIDPQLSLF